MRLKKLIALALAATGFVARLSMAETPIALRSAMDGITAVYEVHKNVNFKAFLQQQPSNSLDALLVFEPPPSVAILVRVNVSSIRPFDSNTRFVTTFRFRNGTEAAQIWKPASIVGKSEFRAIFGLPQDVVAASTKFAE